MSVTLKMAGKTLATHNTSTNVAKIQLGSAIAKPQLDQNGDLINIYWPEVPNA